MALTEKQQKWIIRHFKNTKNDVILHELNISHSALHRFAREHGLKKTAKHQKDCQLNAAMHARKANRQNNWPPKGYIIPRSEENRFKKGVTPLERMGKRRNQQRIRKSAESRKQTVAAEKRRVLFGFDQKTKLKVIPAPQGKLAFKHTLKLRGYICHRASSVIFYDEHTQRSDKSEKTAREKYYFRIEEINQQVAI